MRLTWRDAVATVILGLAGIVVMAVSGSWGWPLLGSYRAGVIALVLLAMPMCAVGGYAFWNSIAFQHPVKALHDPFLAVAMVMGPLAVALIIGGLVTGTEAWFGGLAALIATKWFIATARHAFESEPRMEPRRLAGVH